MDNFVISSDPLFYFNCYLYQEGLLEGDMTLYFKDYEFNKELC